MTVMPDEDDLHAYVDGRLAEADISRVELYLSDHPAVAVRVEGWRRDADCLRRAFAAVSAAPIPPLLLRPMARTWSDKLSTRPSRSHAASVVVALILGGLSGWSLRGSGQPHGLAGLMRQAAIVERVFPMRGSLFEFDASQNKQAVGIGGPEEARSFTAPDLTEAGFQLVGGRLVATEQGSAPMFVYRGQGGKTIGLFIRLMIGIDTNAPMRSVETDGIAGFAWSRHGVGYGLVAAPALRDLSELIRRQTDART